MLKLQFSARPLIRLACVGVLGATLAACGHHGSDNNSPTVSPVAQFISFVTNIVNKGAADTEEPADISGVTPATTETDEPISL